jgi:amino-acid N-acetyltransferase
MATHGLTLRPAAGSIDYVVGRLDAAGLPTDDVREKPARFYLAAVDGQVVGVGGLEPHGDAGLLRSVVVDPDERDRGLGGALVAALEAEAREAGVDTLYLLTDTAPDFFAGHGYTPIDRDAAPPAIQETSEFSELCGDAAVCMHKPI